MEKEKKTWTEPKLTALVRRKPEEGILGACKTQEEAGPGGAGRCFEEWRSPPPCEMVSLT
jgi:hypothetical protein